MFKVMTWNVENFFTPQPTDQPAYDAKLAELVDVIRTAAPDLLAVQEIGDEQSFQALASAGVDRSPLHPLRDPAHDPSRVALTGEPDLG